MPSTERRVSGEPGAAPAAGTFSVRVEGLSWVNQYLGGPGTGVHGVTLEVAPGDTVGDVLRAVGQRFPGLARFLWDRGSGALGEHFEVAVNGTVLGVRHTLDSPVRPGDTILLMGQFQGG